MRVILIITLFNLINVILAQFDISEGNVVQRVKPRKPQLKRFYDRKLVVSGVGNCPIIDIRADVFIFKLHVNEDIGGLQLHAKVGNLPLKYFPLSGNDQKASDKAADVIDFIPLVPDIDPLVIPVIHAFGIDVPFLFLRGKVYLENFVLSGVKQLQLNDIELRLINLRGDINITIPKLHLEADLNVRASLSILPLTLSCHISTYLYDVGVVATGGGYRAQSPAVGEVLQIESAAVNVNIRDIVFNLTHLVLGEELGDNDDSPVTQLFETRRAAGSQSDDGNIFNGLLKNVLGMVNKELFKVSMEVFMEYLLSDTY